MPADTIAAPAPATSTASASPAPAQTATTSTASTGGGGQPPAQVSGGEDTSAKVESAFDRMEARFKPKEEANPVEDKKEKAAAPKLEKAKPEAAAKPEAQPKPGEKRAGEKQLAEELSKVKAERDQSIARIKEYEAKIKDFESRGKDTTALTDQLEAERKEKESLLGQIRRLKKESDPEFIKQVETPLNEEWAYTRELIQKIDLLDENEQPVRKAADKDFLGLYHAYKDDPIGTKKRAKLMFGEDGAGEVVDQIKKLHSLYRTMEKAKVEQEEKWKELETKETADQALHRENFNKARVKAEQDLIASNPDYADDPDDPEGNALIKEAREFMEYEPKTADEAVRYWARNKLERIAAPRLRAQRDKARAELADALATIEEMKNSKPGRTRRETTETSTDGDEEESMADELKRRFASI